MPLSTSVAFCGRPAKVPTTASMPSFWMSMNVLPSVGVNPRLTFSVAPAKLTVPMALS